MAGAFPGGLEDDPLHADEALAAARQGFVHDRFRRPWVQDRVPDEAAVDVVLAHRALTGLVGADVEHAVAGVRGRVEVVELGGRGSDRGQFVGPPGRARGAGQGRSGQGGHDDQPEDQATHHTTSTGTA